MHLHMPTFARVGQVVGHVLHTRNEQVAELIGGLVNFDGVFVEHGVDDPHGPERAPRNIRQRAFPRVHNDLHGCIPPIETAVSIALAILGVARGVDCKRLTDPAWSKKNY